jgi:tetratricopeptide (TPR) repeat protein
MFPNEVAGLVFVDPTDFNETASGRREYVFAPLGHADDGESIRDAIDLYYYKQAGKFSAAIQAEIDESREERQNDFMDIKKFPMPQTPIVIIATTQYPSLNDPNLIVPFDKQKYQYLLLNYRLLSLSMFARSVSEGTLVTTPNSGHYIQEDEPELVSWAIERVLHPSVERRLTAAFEHGGFPSMQQELRLIRKVYPPQVVSEAGINHIGEILLRAQKKKEAVSLLRLNARDHPESTLAAVNLADMESTTGDKESAIRDYKLALKLDKNNEHARERITALSKSKN